MVMFAQQTMRGVVKDKATGEKHIESMFYNHLDEVIDPLSVLKKYCNAHATLKIGFHLDCLVMLHRLLLLPPLE